MVNRIRSFQRRWRERSFDRAMVKAAERYDNYDSAMDRAMYEALRDYEDKFDQDMIKATERAEMEAEGPDFHFSATQ